jgi:hypothetical protein
MELPSFLSGMSGSLSHPDDSAFVQATRAALAEQPGGRWRLGFDDLWCQVWPSSYRQRDQGWKLHLSATVDCGEEVLRRAVGVLLAAGCPFKFASSPDRLDLLNSAHYPRGGAGKFITVYPVDDEQFRWLAASLDEQTVDLSGPSILSDRPFLPGSLVHYRYGGFVRNQLLSNDAEFVLVLTGPDGAAVVDRREAWFAPPPWAPPAFPAPEPTANRVAAATRVAAPSASAAASASASASASAAAEPGAVLLGGRFMAQQAIRHSNRGGVYRALDLDTGADVIVKQARRHVRGNGGMDAVSALRHEAGVLTSLAAEVTPPMLGLFEQDGDLFLAQGLVAGVPLRRWVRERAHVVGTTTSNRTGLPWSTVCELVVRLTGLLATAHTAGWVIRDFTPSNIMVEPGGGLRLVDLEFAARPGERPAAGGTPGYLAPEQARGDAAAPSADLYSLGCLVFMLASGIDPVFATDRPHGRDHHDRMTAWLRLLAADNSAADDPAADNPTAGDSETVRESARRALPLVAGLTAADPAQRWSLERARLFTVGGGTRTDQVVTTRRDPAAAPTGRTPTGDAAAAPTGDAVAAPTGDAVAAPTGDAVAAPTGTADLDRLIVDGLDYLCTAMTPDSADRLWPAACTVGSVDPCNVQHGTAGVLGVLSAAMRCGVADERVRAALSVAVDWTWRRLGTLPTILPGLYFGRSGTAWALHEAALLIDDQTLADRAVELAASVPVGWPNPDVSHGVSGAGLAALHFWRTTGDARFYESVVQRAELVAAAVVRDGDTVRWPIPATFASRLAGLSHFGFAHGVAGVGYFLLRAGQATGREDFGSLAEDAGRTLARAAVTVADGALWPTDAASTDEGVEHWCSGAAGVGTFLIPLAEATGDPVFRALADAGALAAWRRRWYASPVACHGLAGIGEFLLDVAESSTDPRHRARADGVGQLISAQHAVRDGRRLVPDETGTGFGAEYGVGMSGALGFLLRLRHGGPRAWMVDGGSRVAYRARQPVVSAGGR